MLKKTAKDKEKSLKTIRGTFSEAALQLEIEKFTKLIAATRGQIAKYEVPEYVPVSESEMVQISAKSGLMVVQRKKRRRWCRDLVEHIAD